MESGFVPSRRVTDPAKIQASRTDLKLAMSIPASQGWLLAVLGRLRKNFLLKSVGTSAFMVLFFIAYGYILKNPLHPFSVMPATANDRLGPLLPFLVTHYYSHYVHVL